MSLASTVTTADATAVEPGRLGDLRALWTHMRRVGGARLWVALALLLLAGVTEGFSFLLLIPLLKLAQAGGGAIDTASLAGEASAFAWLPAVSVPLVGVLALLVGAAVLQAGVSVARSMTLTRVLCDFTNAVRLSLFDAVGGARWARVMRNRAADTEHLLTGDVDRIQGAGFLLLSIVQTLVISACYAGLALLVSPAMTAFAAAVGLALFVAMGPLRRHSARFGEATSRNRQRQYRDVAEFLGGIKVAKAHNAEALYGRNMARTLRRMTRDTLDHARHSALGGAAFQIASTLAIVAFAWAAIVPLQLSLAQVVVLTVLFARLAPRFMVMQTQAQQLLVALPAYRHVREATDDHRRHAEPLDAAQTRELPQPRRVIALDGVTLRRGGEVVLDGVDLELPIGTATALVGPSGAGKSTLADLVAGLLHPDAGRLRLDDTRLREADLRAWRDRVAYVTQDVHLMHDTIAANLRLARPDADDDALREALRQAQALDFVASLARGLQTVVGEDGNGLSGGERQRLALARALLRAPALLVLDEVTSALDESNAAAIAAVVRALRGQVTVLAVTHATCLVEAADRVVTLDGGRIVATRDMGPAAAGNVAKRGALHVDPLVAA